MSPSDSTNGLPLGEAVSTFPASRPRRTIKSGRHVSLTPLSASRHSNQLWDETSGKENEDLWTYMAEGPFLDHASFHSYLFRKSSEEDPLYFAILNSQRVAVGHLSLMRIDPVHRCIEVGNILFGPSLQKTPGGTEAFYLTAGYAFDDLGYRRLEWKCNALNEPSRRAALRYGFTFEGIFRKHMIVKGRNRDTAWFSMLETEWRTRRLAFDYWLNPNNFDAEGGQRQTLAQISAKSESTGTRP
jgi:RimJ/RimL family protein N-acetyltransferase